MCQDLKVSRNLKTVDVARERGTSPDRQGRANSVDGGKHLSASREGPGLAMSGSSCWLLRGTAGGRGGRAAGPVGRLRETGRACQGSGKPSGHPRPSPQYHAANHGATTAASRGRA